MLFVIVTRFKAHKVKVQEIKRKTFSLNRKGNTLYTLTECHYKKKKKNNNNNNNNNNKRNNKKISSAKPWPLEEEDLISDSIGR